MKIGFVSLGLIGGSIAKAVREKYQDARIVAYNRSREPLVAAFRDGVIDAATHDIDDTFKDCDYIFLCAPVQTNMSFLKKLDPYLKDGTILTDVGSTKLNIHEAVKKDAPGAHFIGGHPMAGKEKSTYANSSKDLIKDCYYFLTPSDTVTEKETAAFKEFIASLGCKPITVEPKLHDNIVAAISHVPHMAAYGLVKLVRDKDTPENYMKETAAGGFKDTTRVASSDPTMWEEICLANKENIAGLLDEYIGIMTDIRFLISKGDSEALHALFKEIKEYRDSIIG